MALRLTLGFAQLSAILRLPHGALLLRRVLLAEEKGRISANTVSPGNE